MNTDLPGRQRVAGWMLLLVAAGMCGCFKGVPVDAGDVAGVVIGAGERSDVVVVLDNALSRPACWKLVWEPATGRPPISRQVTTAAGTLTTIVLQAPVRRIALGGLAGAASGATVLGDEPLNVPYTGPVIVAGIQLFDGDVARFMLAQTPSGPTLTAEVNPAG